MRNTLVIRFGALGDLVLSTVLLEALRAEHPSDHVTWVTKEAWGSLLSDDPRVDELVLLREGEGLRSLAARLAHRNFDRILDAHGNLRSRSLCWLLSPAPTHRIAKDGLARWLLLRGGPRLPSLDRSLVDRYLDLLPDADRNLRPRLRFAGDATEGQRRIALAPGAQHATKRWPTERFAALARRLLDRSETSVLVVGGSGDRDSMNAIAAQVDAVELWDPTRPLAELAAELSSCHRLVGNDSGLLHLAEAVGTPVVGLYGPTVRAWGYYPWDPRSRVLEQELPCRPCSKFGDRPCRYVEPDCLTRTSVDQVHAVLEESWGEKIAARSDR